MKKLRVGIIGTGSISNAHIDGYEAAGGEAQIVSVCDLSREKAEACAQKHGVQGVYTDYNEMLDKEDLDCVSVCTWNRAHKGAAIAALSRGAHVLCEKPMAMNAAEALEMARAAKESGKVLQVGFVHRFGKDAEAVLRLAKAGILGDIYYAKAHFLRRDGCPGGWFADQSYAGGGPLIDLGVHMIDLARYLSGNPRPISAYGVTYDHLGSHRALDGKKEWRASAAPEPFARDVEDLAAATIRFESGLTLQVELSYNLNIVNPGRGVELFGTRAGIEIGTGVEYCSIQGGMYAITKPTVEASFDFTQAFRAEIQNFLGAARGEQESRATARDGLSMMQILDAVYESARTGEAVKIIEQEV